MGTKLDQGYVKAIRINQENANEGFETMVREVERLESYCDKLERAFLAAHKMLVYVQHVAPGYDWNADPKQLTLKIGAIEEHRVAMGLAAGTVDLTN